MSKRIEAFIFCWPGQTDNAAHIAQSIRGCVERLTVLDASTIAVPQEFSGVDDVQWLKIEPTHYYGAKFERALRLFDGEIFLQIQADARSSDWKAVVQACRLAFDEQPRVGIWAPDVWFTLFPTDQVRISPLDASRRCIVAQTDCIVWALACPVIERLRGFDYSKNNLGWGVDWAAVSFCYANQLDVVRDKSCKIEHPRSRNYDNDTAAAQMDAFTAQFSPEEAKHYALLKGFLANTNGGVKRQFRTLLSAVEASLSRRVKQRFIDSWPQRLRRGGNTRKSSPQARWW